jgi:predicted Rossmann fold nucleotide-binding protein DprA/Smf involved in DNA uptake
VIASRRSFPLFLLCTHLGSTDDLSTPLTTREWNQLEKRLSANSLSAADLLGLNESQIKTVVPSGVVDSKRLSKLLSRQTLVERELERLDSAGIWAITRNDYDYPSRFRERLKKTSPVILYGAGDVQLLNTPGLAVVGSRDIDPSLVSITEFVGNACAESKLTVYSGGARGVDKTAMSAALAAGGTVVGLLADSLEKACRLQDARQFIEDGRLVLATTFSPDSGFSVGMAMTRNKLIYALSDYALVIASDAERGGTWSGATEALKSDWIPLFILEGPNVPEGNRLLIKRGGIPFPESYDDSPDSLRNWFEEHAAARRPVAIQGTLF